MRALFSKQEEPLLYRSTGNYFSHVLRSNLLQRIPEKRPKVHFALFLKTRISTNEAHVSSSFTVRFHPFSLKFGNNGWLPVTEQRKWHILKSTHKSLYTSNWPNYLRLETQ